VYDVEKEKKQKLLCITVEFLTLAASPSASNIVCFGLVIDSE
jgi:hypothetical protein